MAFIACTLHGTRRCECDKQVLGVNIVTIMTAKTFSAGVLLTIVPRLTIKFNKKSLRCLMRKAICGLTKKGWQLSPVADCWIRQLKL